LREGRTVKIVFATIMLILVAPFVVASAQVFSQNPKTAEFTKLRIEYTS